MRLMVMGKENPAAGRQVRKFVTNRLSQIQFLIQPGRHRPQEAFQPQRRDGQRGFQQPRELRDGFVIKDDRVQVGGEQSGVLEAKPDRAERKPLVILEAREAFLLRGRHDLSITQQGGGRIVVVGGDAQDVAHGQHFT